MALKFTKMHALGNDFMVLDAIRQPIHLTPQAIKMLSNRHKGIGFDQCLIAEKSNTPGIDFFYRIFNADGQEVGQCGNGARCLARFLHDSGLTQQNRIRVSTKTTQMTLLLNEDKTVTVDMGLPSFHPQDIPLEAEKEQPYYSLPLNDGSQQTVHAVNVGNPHALIRVDDIEAAPVAAVGKAICTHPFFPQQTNVGFMQILDKHHIRLRVYERGCGETLACGSGAVAAVAIGRRFHDLADKVHVQLPGGELRVDWPDFDSPLLLTGTASFVYEGVLSPCVL